MTEDKVAISVEIQCSLRYCVSITDKYRAEEPRYLWYCSTKKYRKGDGTGTVEKWYRGAAVVPWYRTTLATVRLPRGRLATLRALEFTLFMGTLPSLPPLPSIPPSSPLTSSLHFPLAHLRSRPLKYSWRSGGAL